MQFRRIHKNDNNMKTYAFLSPRLFHVTGLMQLVCLFLMLPLTTPCFGDPQSNLIPWSDDFESYTAQTPLIDGTNGWYGTSNIYVVLFNTVTNICIVQTNIVRSGTNAAMIMEDCTLSNRFVSMPTTNVWIQMDTMPSLYDGTNNPVVDTNVAVMFYVNTNGEFVVHNGFASNSLAVLDPTNSVNWVVASNGKKIATNGLTWARISIYEDFALKKWNLYADGVLVTNNIKFIDANLTNFVGFDVYNGAMTTYLDNVSVTDPWINNLPLIVIPPALSQSYYANLPDSVNPLIQTVKVINVWSTDIGFQARTNQYWVIASRTNGTVTNGTTQDVVLTYADIKGWVAGVSNATVTVVATNGDNYWGTQTVQVVLNLLNISNVLSVTPTWFSNNVWVGATPTSRQFEVRNLGDLSFNYTVSTGSAGWIASSSNAGTLGAYENNTLTMTYQNTALWAQGLSNIAVTVVATNSSLLVTATQTVDVWLNAKDFAGVMQVSPWGFTNDAWVGDTPTQRTFTVRNTGDFSFAYAVRTTHVWIAASPTSGIVAAQTTNTVTLTYRPTWAWMAGTTSNATAIVSSADGFGVTQAVAVRLNLSAPAANYYVATNGGNVFPYTNWLDAAVTLTGAVYKANCYTNVGTVVWLSNGVHNLSNQVTLSNVTVRSLNGATSVMLNGGNFRGFNLVHTGATLNGLTITNCRAGITNGGAVYVATGLVWNCRLLQNTATNGGGVAVGERGVVRNCLIWGNTATNGGGVYFYVAGTNMTGRVESCTIASNYAALNGGGLYTATNTTGVCMNTVAYMNSVGSGLNTNWGTNIEAAIVFSNSCVGLPELVAGNYNIINIDPSFVNVTIGDCRLANGSLCINAGTNQAWMVNGLDLAGNMRQRFGRVDMGAYEWYPYQGMGIRVNGVRYEMIKFINGVEPLWINGVTNSSSAR